MAQYHATTQRHGDTPGEGMSERFGNLDMEKIAKGLGAERRGKVAAGGGFFGALQVAEEVRARFRVPAKGGRATDLTWTERPCGLFIPRGHSSMIPSRCIQKRLVFSSAPITQPLDGKT